MPDSDLPDCCAADASFDVVFSKDAIIHVADKRSLFAEALRVLRPGGRLLVGDWLRGDGGDHTRQVAGFIDTSGHESRCSLRKSRRAASIV
jgi:SAM-dependent methyltransferase